MELSRKLLFACAIFSQCFVIVKGVDLKSWDFHPQNSLSEDTLNGILDSDEMANILKEELQFMRKDLTAMFVEDLSRKKREMENYEYEIILEPLEYTHGPGVNSTFPSDEIAEQAYIFQDHILDLKKDGIYRIQAHKPSNESNYSNQTLIVEEVLLGKWDLSNPGDEYRVTATIEKNNIFFILVTAKKSGFSYLFTYSPLGSGVSLRQRIRNAGVVTDAKFFIFYDVLYLVITHDNEVHSITLCPIFKWMGTHLDEIHVVHTRGASSVAAIEISSHMYIAIAQSLDAAGNKEIGTQIIRMDRKSEVEKVQLLYSDHPKSLYFTKFLHEYILIIVQQKMPAIVYFFGGYDFIYLQYLDTLKGSGVKLVSVLAPDGETYILASNGTQITTYSRSSAISRLTALMFVPYPNSTYVASNGSRITGITVRPPQFHEDGSQDDRLIFIVKLAPTATSSLGYRVELHTLFFQQVLKAESTYKQPEDKLSKCLFKLQKSLANSEPSIVRLQESNAVILRKSDNMVYPGTLNSQASISFDSETTKAESIIVKPNVNIDDESKHSPSQILGRIETGISYMEDVIQKKLGEIFLRNRTNTVTGNLDFVNGVSVDYLTTNHITTENVNGISWQQLRTNVLRTDPGRPQIVSGNWEIDEVQSDSVQTTQEISGMNISDVLLTHTEPNEIQFIKGSLEFTKNVKFSDLIIPRSKSINEIRINDIINTTAGGPIIINRDITAGTIYLKPGTILRLINEINITEWYNSVLKTNGPDQFGNGTYFFLDTFNAENVTVDQINGIGWEEFLESCLRDGVNQTITGETHFDKLDVKHLQVETINGIRIADLLNRYSHQIIQFPVHLAKLHITGNISNSYINGLDLSKDVVLYNTNADIFGPLNVRNLTVKNIKFAEGVRVSGIDIVKAEKARTTIVYKIKGNPNTPIVLNSILAQDVNTERVNNIPISNFGSKYWTKSGPNNVPVKFDLSGIPVIISKGFETEKINGVSVGDYVKIKDEDRSPSTTADEYINTPINFKAPVDIHGAITLGPNVTLNYMDFADIIRQIVHTNDSGVVYGTKTFKGPVVVKHGIGIGFINNYSVENDFVMLRNGWTSYALPDLEFDDLHSQLIDIDEATTIGGTLNGLNISEIKENTVYSDRPAVIQSNVEFLQDVEAENLFVAGLINNYSVADILDRIIILDNGNITQYLYINIDVLGALDFYGPVDIDSINGVNPTQYFSSLVNRSNDQYIHGVKTFQGEVIVEGDLICKYGKLNNISLPELESEAVSKTKDQIITGKITFQELYAHNINTATICGIPISDFAQIDNPNVEEIQSPVVFTNSTTVKKDITLNGTFNGFDINEVKRNLTHIPGQRHFENVTCSGNLTWLHDRREIKGLSYLFNNAVRLSAKHPRTIKGNVTFKAGFTAKDIIAEMWINGVNLENIKEDGVYANEAVNFTGYNRIPVLYIGKTGSLDVLKSLDTEVVNGVNLTDLSHSVVRQNQPEIVRGKKTFENSVKAGSIFTDDINGCSVSDIAVVNDNRPIEAITLESVEGISNLNFNHLNLFGWREFLENRVTMKSNQTIGGNWVIKGSATVKEFSAKVLNDLNLSDAVRTNSPRVQTIHGVKIFKNLIITGDIDADSINEYNIDHFCSIMVHKDRQEDFNGTVYMYGPVAFYKDVDIDDHFNGYNLEHATADFQDKLENYKQVATPSGTTKRETKELLEVLEVQLHDAAVWLDYLKLAEELHLSIGYPDRVEVAVVEEVARIAFSKLVPVTNNKCGLPNGCLTKSIEMVEFGSEDYNQFPPIDCQNIFEVSSSYNENAYGIVSSVNSYNTTCTSGTQESTQIYVITSTLSNATNIDRLIGEVTTGYITDVKTFHNSGVDYIVIAQFFGTQESEIGIYAIKNNTIHKLQSIPTKGTIRIAMDHIHGRCFLGVANTLSTVPSPHFHEDPDIFDEEEKKSTTYSEVYIWSRSNFPGNEHFILLREIATKNVVDLQFLDVYPNDHGFDRDSFIAFVHSDNVVEIYKYHTDRRNFFIFQTLAFDDEYQVTSLSSFYLKSSTYLIISSVPQGLLIYQYRCIEGFKFYLQVPLPDVQDFTYFVSHKKIFFPVASSEPLVAQGKIQGPAF